ncbi:MAG TPA: class I SAM-dependent methyltransferase [Acidimicrobiales bacterium]|jgi:SAM-dependent methyltransferase|nr:class I SAM-dependent methyltransferase [Acidimicrobiales bacterium]
MGDNDRGPGEQTKIRSGSFGEVASTYERFRPGPPEAAITWMLPDSPATVVDLGAGTGAMTRDLVGRVGRIIAVEPDDRMRGILAGSLPEVTALRGTGESIPLDASSVDAVLASSSWHWMEPDRALEETARVLVPGGTLGVVWAGPDPDGPFLTQAQAMLSEMSSGPSAPAPGSDRDLDLGTLVMDTDNRVETVLQIPDDAPFAQPEQQILTWDVALTADELIGLLGTFSWIITMPGDRRTHVIAEARRLLRDGLGIVGDVTVDVQYRSEAWRTQLT